MENIRSLLPVNASAGLIEKGVPVTLFFIWIFIVLMTFTSGFNQHCDEKLHYSSAKYYFSHWLPPQVGEPETIDSYSYYGYSYLNERDFVYILAGKFAIVLSFFIRQDYLTLRLFNNLLFLLLVLYSLFFIESRIILSVALITPQLWYIFTYFNNDATAFFISIIIISELANKNSFFQKSLGARNSSQFITAGILMGLLFGLLFLCKRNYYVFIAFFLFIVVWQIWKESGSPRKQILLRYLFVIGLGLSIFLLRYGYDVAINGWHKPDKMLAMAEKMALPDYKPSLVSSPEHAWGLNLRAKGVKYHELFSQWGWHRMSIGSFFGVYDWYQVRSAVWYYILIFFIASLFLIYIFSNILIQGESIDKLFMLIAMGFMFIIIFASTYHSWVNDWQPQGRYLFPILAMVALLLYKNQKNLNISLISIFITILCTLSFYSFIFTGLSHYIYGNIPIHIHGEPYQRGK